MRIWEAEAGWEREVLERILALLLSFADLADCASLLPAPARPRLLALLGRAEFEARSFLMDMAFDAPASGAEPVSPASADAGRLAAGFRALALALAAILARIPRPAPAHAGGDRAGPPVRPLCAAPGVSQVVRAPDTS